MARLYTNNAESTLASGIASGDTSLTVQSGDGALFPNPSGGDYFIVTLYKKSTGDIEIVKCTARSTDTLTVVRAQESTSAVAFLSGDPVELRPTAAGLEDIMLGSSNLSDVDSASTSRTNLGLVIGTDVQAFHAYLTDIAGITAAQGDIIYFDGTDWVNLGPGTSGHFLKTQGAAADPVWAANQYAVEFIESQTASASATIDFETLSTDYYKFIIDFDGVLPTTDGVEFEMRFGTGGTPTYQSGASDYAYAKSLHGGANADTGDYDGAHTAIRLTGSSSNWDLGTAANEDRSGTIEVINPHNASAPTHAFFKHSGRGSGALYYYASGSGMYLADTAVTAIRLMMNSGTIATGTFKLYGVRGA